MAVALCQNSRDLCCSSPIGLAINSSDCLFPPQSCLLLKNLLGHMTQVVGLITAAWSFCRPSHMVGAPQSWQPPMPLGEMDGSSNCQVWNMLLKEPKKGFSDVVFPSALWEVQDAIVCPALGRCPGMPQSTAPLKTSLIVPTF